MVINEDTILYFTGTGNCLQVAKDVNDLLGTFKLSKITFLTAKEKIQVRAKTLGIVFPVYYACVPLIVEKVLNNLQLDEGTYVFAIATHGGFPGRALNQFENILETNNNTLNSGFLVQMPGNYVMGYGARPIKTQNKAFKNEKEKVKQICSIIEAKRNLKCESSKFLIDRLFTKSMYKSMKKIHTKDCKFWVNEHCDGCRVCEKVCPVNNIEFYEDKPTWTHKCEQCTACIQYCPKEALQWGKKTIKRKRYRNPNIKISELIKDNKIVK